MLTKKNQIILFIKLIAAILVGLVSTLLSILLRLNHIGKIFMISTAATFIVLSFILWSITRAFKQNVHSKFHFSLFDGFK